MKARLIPLLFALGCAGESAPRADKPPAAESRPVIVFMGDSLTAGYGVAMEEAYPALIAARNPAVEIRNAGVSGQTSAGVLENMAWNLTPEVGFVFLAIGANDGLRGLELTKTRENIEGILAMCRDKNIKAALAGMKLPPNYGPAYTQKFERMFSDAAKEYAVPLMPFLLEGVGGNPAMNLEDGIHPNAEGHRVIADNVESFLKKEGWLP